MPSKSLLRRYVGAFALVERRAGALVLITAAVAVGAAATARSLELRTDLAELLPADHPAVTALRDVTPRQRSAGSLSILVDAPSAERARAFTDALYPALEALRPTTVTSIDWGPDPEPARFAARWRWLYADLVDLAEVERLADAIALRRSSPLYVDLDDDRDPADELAALEARMRAHLPTPPPHARFQSDDGRTVGVRIWRRREGLGGAGDHEAMTAIRAAVAATGPASFGATVRYTGPIAQAIEEQAAIRDDLSIATIACVALVLLVLYLALGGIALVSSALWPALLGVLLALALAARTIGALNLNTAFLVSIILGNGINAPIVLLVEVRRLREGGRSLRAALVRAIPRSIRGVSVAMLAAAAAYGVLGLTRFRGFRQFGLIGGVGMVAVLAATYLAVPPFLLVCARRWPARTGRGRDRFSPPVLHAIRALRRHAWPVAIVASLAAAIGVVRFARAPIEWNLSTLRSKQGEAGRLWPQMEALGMGSVGAGYIANTAVMLVDDAAEAEPVAAALRDADRRGERLLGTVRTLGGLLPTAQDEKLAILARLRGQIDRTLSRHGHLLDDDEARRLREARPPEELRAIDADDLPRVVREAFTEVDGTRGRLIGIDADPERYSDWNGHTLLRLSRSLSVELDGKRHVAAAAATVFAGMLETLLADAPRLAAAALAVVVALVLALLGVRGVPVLGALALGLFWLFGAAGLVGARLNFMSFAAVPISIGVGVDYAANLWSAPRGPGSPIAATVVLCSLTTILGYSTLLLGHNGALRSLGLLADLGEVTCLAAALLSPVLFARRTCR